jgi:hypothetical protein
MAKKQNKGGEKRGGKEGRGMHDSPADQRRRERVAREQAESGKSPSAQRPKFRQQRRSNGNGEIPAILLDPLARVNVPAAAPIKAQLDQVLANPHVGFFDVGGGVVLEFLTDHRSNMAVRFIELPQDHACYNVWSLSPDTFLLTHFLGWDRFVSKVPVEKMAKSQNAIWESLGPSYRKVIRHHRKVLPSPVAASSTMAEALAPVKEELERAKYSSNATKFIGGEQGEYAFPKSGSVLLRMTARREIVLLGVEEGNPLFEILKGHEHVCRFTIDHLTGKTALPKDVRKDEDPLHIAIRRLCRRLREFLKPYGLKEEVVKAEPPVRDPSREITLEQFVAGGVGQFSFERVSLKVVDGQGNTGKPRVEVSVVAVDTDHPDYEFLQGLVGKRMFISSYVVKLGPDYPRDKLKGKSESELDSLEALFLLLRRAFGHQAEFMRDKKATTNLSMVIPQPEGTPEGATIH